VPAAFAYVFNLRAAAIADHLSGLIEYADQLVRAAPPQGQGFTHFDIQRRAAYTEGNELNQAFQVHCLCCQKHFISGGTVKKSIHAAASLANFKTHVATPRHQKCQAECQQCTAAAASAPNPPAPSAIPDAAAAGKCQVARLLMQNIFRQCALVTAVLWQNNVCQCRICICVKQSLPHITDSCQQHRGQIHNSCRQMLDHRHLWSTINY
jgi:hypothetical protein